MIYIRFVNEVKLALIKHAQINPTRECGGFLYGKIVREKNNIICDIDAIYYENKLGSDCEFNFNLSYIENAKKVLKQLKSECLMGTYHSHGLYDATFSDVDRNKLQKFFGENKITMIYSPTYSQLVGEFLDENGISHKARIVTK
ncbi:MAG TPA: hypothetical protein GX747_02230 [Tenericutes bacterium]|nr:hypothetical protein [Mycoplasmatota bacterium]